MKTISRNQLSHQVYLLIKEMILNYRFQAGARINVEKIAKELDVSRTPTWEAMSKLEQEGLVVKIPHRGIFAASLTPEKALELYAVRERLEGMAASLSAPRINKLSLAKMAKSLEKQIIAVEKKDLISYSQLDFEFHNVIYETCGNTFLQELLESIKNQMRSINVHLEIYLPSLYEDHKRIYQTLKEGDPQKAENIIRAHNRSMMDHIREASKADQWLKFEVG
ncbi:MAG: GntR family transcriptional regulator [SAR324 cluster bacterium]|nr:GntR family transcriptional regulator [SAR324 cluster bacterium]